MKMGMIKRILVCALSVSLLMGSFNSTSFSTYATEEGVCENVLSTDLSDQSEGADLEEETSDDLTTEGSGENESSENVNEEPESVVSDDAGAESASDTESTETATEVTEDTESTEATSDDTVTDSTDSNDVQDTTDISTVDESSITDDSTDADSADDIADVADSAATDTSVEDIEIESDVVLTTETLDSFDNSSRDLKDYLVSAQIDTTTDEDGKYVISVGAEYSVYLKFEETKDNQFPITGSMTYELPEGFESVYLKSDEVIITISDSSTGEKISVPGNKFSVNDGILTFTWNTEDSNFQAIADCGNVAFGLGFTGKFDGTTTEISFSDGIVKDIVIDNEPEIAISKSVYFNKSTLTASYTVVVTSTNTNTNVVVTDSMEGSALIYQNDVTYSGNSTTPTGGSEGNGFKFTFPSMKNNEKITFKYTAKLDTTKLDLSANSGRTTYDETKNTATVVTDYEPDGQSVTKSFSNYTYSTITKSNGVQTGIDTVTWTITANKEQIASLAGTTITDKIADSSKGYLEYSGDGIEITVTKEDGTTEVRNVSWDQVDMTGKGDYDWEYTVPDTDGKYKYVIKYTTSTDASSLLGTKTLYNYVYGEVGNYRGSYTLTPGGTEVSVSKTHLDFDASEVTWKISIVLPANKEYTYGVLWDYYPSCSSTYYDSFGELVSVDGLLDGESYSIDTSSSNQFIIRFYKDEKQSRGFITTDTDRTITVTYKSKINEDWLEKSKTDSSLLTHTNKAKVTINSTTLTCSDSVTPKTESLKKSYIPEESGTVTIDGVAYPYFKYNVVISGNIEDTFTISDEFDTNYLRLYTESAESDSLMVYGGDKNSQTVEGTKATYVVTDNGVEFTGNAIDGCTYYKLVYYLIAKDATALGKLTGAAYASDNSTYTLTNTATYEDCSDTVTADYTSEVLTKELINADEISSNNRVAKYSITFNPYGKTLNNGENITVTDTFSDNLNILYNTVEFSNEDAIVKYYVKGNTATFEVKDATPVTITYSAIIIGTGEQTITNSVTALGYTQSVDKSEVFSSEGTGSGDSISINVLKCETGDMNKKLAGAKFRLYEADGDVPVYFNDDSDAIFVTDEEGLTTIGGSGSGLTLYENVKYYLVETEAPAGYVKSTEKWYFTITKDNALVDTDNYIYPVGYTMRITNSPETDNTTDNDDSSDDSSNNSSTEDENPTVDTPDATSEENQNDAASDEGSSEEDSDTKKEDSEEDDEDDDTENDSANDSGDTNDNSSSNGSGSTTDAATVNNSGQLPDVLGSARKLPDVLGARRANTSDETNVGQRVVFMAIAVGGAALLLMAGRKKKKKRK